MAIRRDNRWIGGSTSLDADAFGPLDPLERGLVGATFREAVFVDGQDPEIILHILEEASQAHLYSGVKSLDLVAFTLFLNTDCGPVSSVIWRFADRGHIISHIEHFLNPLNTGTRLLLGNIESQMQLKVLMRDNLTGKIINWWCFDNVFGMGLFGEQMSQIVPRGIVAPFSDRLSALRSKYSLEDLITMLDLWQNDKKDRL